MQYRKLTIERETLQFRSRDADIDVHFGGIGAPGPRAGAEGVERDFGVLITVGHGRRWRFGARLVSLSASAHI